MIERVEEVDCTSGGSDRDDVSALKVGQEVGEGEEPG